MSCTWSREHVRGGVVVERGRCLRLELRQDPLRQHLTELDAASSISLERHRATPRQQISLLIVSVCACGPDGLW